MRLLLRCLLIGLITLSFDFQAHAQWQTIDKNAIPNQLSQELSPNRSQLLRLDLPAIQQTLAQAPHESQVSLSQSNLIVDLPQADGSTRAFRLLEYNALAPALMAKFPGLHTYYGEAVSNTRIRVRVDLSVKGLRVMGVSEDGQWFVDPYAKGNTEYYIAYAKADYPVTKAWQCDFDASMIRPSGNASTSSRAGDCQFRVYRLAMATRGEYTNYHGGLVGTIAELANMVNRLNEIYERDLSVRLQLIANNDLIIYTDPSTDPYSGGVFTNLNQNRSNLNAVIGSANYDVGHVVGAGGIGGVASFASVCISSEKARGATSLPNPIGDPFVIDFVAHELGHQFGGSHTQNNNCNRDPSQSYEPGSGVTIMGYAGICSPNVQSNSIAMFGASSMTEMQQTILNSSCATLLTNNNQSPVVDAGRDYIIPHSTPFVLTADASDVNGDSLSYSWEQYDRQIATMPPSTFSTSGPAFRPFLPTNSPKRTVPRLVDIINNNNPTWEVLSAVGRSYNFRATVRDNASLGACTAEDDMVVTVAGGAGPFVVTLPNTAVTWIAGAMVPITWNVASTDLAPVNCEKVDIYLSTDGGFTYPILLAAEVLNDGTTTVQVPNFPGSQNRVRIQGHDNIFFDISDQNFTITPAAQPAVYMNILPRYRNVCTEDSFRFDIQLDSIGIINNPVDISFDNIPPGVSITSSANQINLPASISAVFVADTTVASGDYSILVTAENGDGIITSQTVDVTVRNELLATPPIISILNNQAINVPFRPTFTWLNVDGVFSFFDLEVSLSPTFDSLVIFAESVTGTQYIPTTDLASGTVYYWRMRSNDECGKGPYSNINAFQTSVRVCQEFSPASLPVEISTVGTPVSVSLVIVSGSYLISDVNIKNLDISHDNLSQLSVKLNKPGGASALLFNNLCDSTGVFKGNFTDQGQLIGCPANDSSLTYRPIEPFTNFNGSIASGAWVLEISDNQNGGGGFLNDWSLEVCQDTLPRSVPNLLNQGMAVFQGEQKDVPSTRLLASSTALAADDMVYTLLSLPVRGDLLLSGTPLALGAQFTQADIDNGFLEYAHDSSAVLTDAFNFSVLDANGGWIPSTTFNINVWLTDIEPELADGINWQLQPNPAQNEAFVTIETERSSRLQLKILNLSGQLVRQQTISLQAGQRNEYPIEIGAWPAGIYLVELTGDGFRQTQKLVVRR